MPHGCQHQEKPDAAAAPHSGEFHGGVTTQSLSPRHPPPTPESARRPCGRCRWDLGQNSAVAPAGRAAGKPGSRARHPGCAALWVEPWAMQERPSRRRPGQCLAAGPAEEGSAGQTAVLSPLHSQLRTATHGCQHLWEAGPALLSQHTGCTARLASRAGAETWGQAREAGHFVRGVLGPQVQLCTRLLHSSKAPKALPRTAMCAGRWGAGPGAQQVPQGSRRRARGNHGSRRVGAQVRWLLLPRLCSHPGGSSPRSALLGGRTWKQLVTRDRGRQGWKRVSGPQDQPLRSVMAAVGSSGPGHRCSFWDNVRPLGGAVEGWAEPPEKLPGQQGTLDIPQSIKHGAGCQSPGPCMPPGCPRRQTAPAEWL